jgi:hypothetical protein
VNGNTPVRIAGLVYDTDPRYPIYTTLVDTVTREKSFSLKMTGLTPNTKYYVKAWAGESGRAIGYGAVKEFTTLPE